MEENNETAAGAYAAPFATRFDMQQAAGHRMVPEGWLVKRQWIDKQPGGELLGIRITNAAKLYELAWSIQLFDRNTATLSIGGFDNDSHVTLSKEDGAAFIEWMHLNGKMSDEVYDALATIEPDDTEARPIVNMAKNRLVNYLVENYAETFGRYGSLTVESTDFYDEVLALVKDPARDDVTTRQLIAALESMAHDFYRAANIGLRAAGADATANQLAQVDGLLKAAEECRRMANEKRERTPGAPPESDYPEAITRTVGERPPAPAPKGDDYALGSLAHVTDPNSSRHQQIGEVVRVTCGPGGFAAQVYLRFQGAREIEPFTAGQVEPIPDPKPRQ